MKTRELENYMDANGNDIKILQDMRMIQQVINSMPKGVGVQNNFVMIGQLVESTHVEPEFDFEKFLELLPQPRLKRLADMAIEIAKKRCPNNEAAAGAWLGGTKRLISYRKNKTKEVLSKIDEDI